MKHIKEIIASLAILGLFVGGVVMAATLQGYQGGTGYSTTTAGNVGNFLQVASTSPFLTYTFAPGSGGISSLNGQTSSTQTFATSGPALSISSLNGVHTFTLPTSTASQTGVLSSTDWTTFNNKVSSQWTSTSTGIFYNGGSVGIGIQAPDNALEVNGTAHITNNFIVGGTASTTGLVVVNNTTTTGLSIGSLNGILKGTSGVVGIATGGIDYQPVGSSTINTLIGPWSLVAGTNITLSSTTNPSTLTINSTGGGGTPGGSDTQVQFNNGGAFGGKSTFTYSSSSEALKLSSTTSSILVGTSTQFSVANPPNTPTYDTASNQDSGAGVTTYSFTYTVGTGSNTGLGIEVSTIGSTNDILTNVSYNGASSTRINTSADLSNKRTYTYIITGVATGAHTLKVDSNAATTFDVTVASYFNVKQSNLASDYATSTFTTAGATSMAVTVTTIASSSLVVGSQRGEAGGVSAGAQTTQRVAQAGYYGWQEATSTTAGNQSTLNVNMSSAAGDFLAFAWQPTPAGTRTNPITGQSSNPWALAVGNHIITGGSLPSISGCGSGAFIGGNDTAGYINTGTGTVTSCVLTFAQQYAAAPSCVVSPTTAIASSTVTTSSSTVTFGGTSLTSNTLNYICLGF